VSTRDNDEVRHADEMVIGGNFAANWLQEFLGFREQHLHGKLLDRIQRHFLCS
jgi:hypothetical protein